MTFWPGHISLLLPRVNEQEEDDKGADSWRNPGLALRERPGARGLVRQEPIFCVRYVWYRLAAWTWPVLPMKRRKLTVQVSDAAAEIPLRGGGRI